MTPSISIIIVNYNTGALLVRCMDSIRAQADQACSVIVVDNASIDDSVERMRARYSKVHLIVNKSNLGFAAANNQAIGKTRDNLLFFLNPDTELQPGCLKAIREFMACHPEVGMAGPAIYNTEGSPHDSMEYSYPGGHYGSGQFDNLPGEIAWILGAAMVARREVIETVQGFDERFFLYAEDMDLCLQIRRQGWPLGFIADAGVMHLEGQSEKKAPFADVMKRKVQSELLFLNKYYELDVVQKIKRVRLLEAWWRIICLRTMGIFFRLTDENRKKLTRYLVVAEVYGQTKEGRNR